MDVIRSVGPAGPVKVVGVVAWQLRYDLLAILVVAAVGWVFAPETRDESPLEHTPVRALGPEACGELP